MLVVVWDLYHIYLTSLCGSHTGVVGFTLVSSNLISESCRVTSTEFMKSRFNGRRCKSDSKIFKSLEKLPHNSEARHCVCDGMTILLGGKVF